MTIEQPVFPTPEDELRAAQLWQAARQSADVLNDAKSKSAPEVEVARTTSSQK